MILSNFRALLASTALLLLSACGGGNADQAAPTAAPAQLLAQNAIAGDCSNAPCAAPAIDGLAEEYRHRAMARKNDDADAEPAYPRVPSSAVEQADPEPRS
jgi:ABC-type phosphate transport system substrate-binding protein